MHIDDVRKYQAQKDHLMRHEGKHPANRKESDYENTVRERDEAHKKVDERKPESFVGQFVEDVLSMGDDRRVREAKHRKINDEYTRRMMNHWKR